MSERYPPSISGRAPRLVLERWLLLVIVIGCLLTAAIAFGAYRLAISPAMPSVLPPAGWRYGEEERGREGADGTLSPLLLSSCSPSPWLPVAAGSQQPRSQSVAGLLVV
ncbi:MAG: hypothetical protein M5U01_08805 [Ardenticatenaceae bacterium]|nr:hypothetical protein [Ardenticatenaceae bacterium]HBY93153.1 hypothetical protein [Chloroflexota bacterium]